MNVIWRSANNNGISYQDRMDTMSNNKNPLLTDEFLDELAKEISQLYGGPSHEQNDVPQDLKNSDIDN